MWIKYDPWQIDFLKTEGDKILVTGRQVGKTETCGADAAEWAVHNKGAKPVVMVAPLEKQAAALFNKTLAYLQQFYPRMICRGKDRPTLSRIRLTNGVEIYCLPVGQSGLNIRFLTIGRLYMDEAARIPEEVFVAIQPALLTTGGAQIMLSTLNGAKGTFYDCFVNKDEAYNSFKRFSVSTEKVVAEREICATWTEDQKTAALLKLEQAKARMSQAEYAQEYLGVAMLDMSRFFSDDLITKTCILKRRNNIIPHRKYYVGVDVSALGDDETTLEIIDKLPKDYIEQVENLVTNRVYTTDTSERLIFLHSLYKFKKMGIDSSGVGFGVFSELLNESKTKSRTVAMEALKRPLDDDGERSKTILKEQMYFRLLALMEKGKIKLLDDQNLIESLKSISFKLILKPGQATRHEIEGNYSHIAEGLVRAVFLASEDKTLELWAA